MARTFSTLKRHRRMAYREQIAAAHHLAQFARRPTRTPELPGTPVAADDSRPGNRSARRRDAPRSPFRSLSSRVGIRHIVRIHTDQPRCSGFIQQPIQRRRHPQRSPVPEPAAAATESRRAPVRFSRSLSQAALPSEPPSTIARIWNAFVVCCNRLSIASGSHGIAFDTGIPTVSPTSVVFISARRRRLVHAHHRWSAGAVISGSRRNL